MDVAELIRRAEAPAGLTDEQLTATRDRLFTAFESASTGEPTVDLVNELSAISAAAERTVREQKAREQGSRMDAIAASAGIRRPSGQAARMAARNGRAGASPEALRQAGTGRVSIRAEASSRNIVKGDPITSSAELAEIIVERLQEQTGRDEVCARAIWDYPEDRRLSKDDALGNSRLIEAVCSPQALVASGGVCLPVNVDYSVPTWATADRPFRDALPAFQADRGGLRYVTPPDLGVPSLQGTASGLGSATSVWTEATDASPGSSTKPVYAVQCGSEQLVYVNAIPTRVQFGNMQGRFAPEQIAANTDVALAVAAREAELELQTLMANASVQVKPQQFLGATRDLLASADLLVAQYRYSHRIPDHVQLTAVFPAWAKSIIRADLAREIGHDNAGPQNVLAITYSQIETWFTIRGVNVVWTIDGLKAGTYGTGGSAITNQFFQTVSAIETGAGSAQHPQWPGQSASAASCWCGSCSQRERSSSLTAAGSTSVWSGTRRSTARTITSSSWRPSRASHSEASRRTRSSQ